MKLKGILLIGVVLAFAGGCAKKAETGLQGRWQSNCVEGSSAALVGQADIGVTQRSDLEISETEVVETSYISSSSCEKNDLQITARGPYSLSSQSVMNIQNITYSVRPRTEFAVRVLNLSKWCGFSDWKIDEDRDVTNEAGKAKCFSSRSAEADFSVGEKELRISDSDRLRTSTFGIKSGIYFGRM